MFAEYFKLPSYLKHFHKTKLSFKRIVPRYHAPLLRSMMGHKIYDLFIKHKIYDGEILPNLVREFLENSGNIITENHCSI